MTDQEKIKWFDDTITWMEQWDDNPASAVEYCSDPAYDLFFDMVEQYKKVKTS
jgi:hypothetical protein